MNIDITGTDLTCAVSITGAVYPTKTAIPSIDYACTCNNRVWGVKGDNVYASRLGNIDDWTTMNADPLVTDAWTVDTGSPGDFTGIVTYKNSVYAFKKDAMYKQFGFKPIEFELVKINAIGCISPKSIVEVNEVLYWLAKDGIYRFTGGNPELISYPLNETYVSGVAGRDNKRYYISLYNGTTYKLYTYDTEFGVWETEDQSNIKEFIYQYTSAAPQGYLAVLRSDNKIYRYNYGTEAITMMVATKVFTEDTTRKKGYSNVCFRVDLESGTTLGIYVKSDNLTEVLEKTYTADDFRSFVVPIPVRRCDHMQILFTLTGEGKIYAMEREMYIGSKVGETFDNPES